MDKRLFLSLSLVLGMFSPFVANAEYTSLLGATQFTPSTYILPSADPFEEKYVNPKPRDAGVDVPPEAAFTILTNQRGFSSNNVGTINTIFTFDASTSHDKNGNRIEVRWDFENDGKFDSYFSRIKRVQHVFPTPGIYEVKLEVLDNGGNISTAKKKITIVENTAPFAFFVYSPEAGTDSTNFTFNTQLSSDDQSLRNSLMYRFDWNGDELWDTEFSGQTSWRHRFDASGEHFVIMEVLDPEGLKSSYGTAIYVFENTAPAAAFTYKMIQTATGDIHYEFDASESADVESQNGRLLYRWDFDYHGPNDIISDTTYIAGTRQMVRFPFSGERVIRLEVKDQDGVSDYAYVMIEVP